MRRLFSVVEKFIKIRELAEKLSEVFVNRRTRIVYQKSGGRKSSVAVISGDNHPMLRSVFFFSLREERVFPV